MNSKNSKMPDPHRLKLNLSDKISLNKSDKFVVLSNLTIQLEKYTWKNIKNSYRNNKFKIPVHAWNDKFELPDGSILSRY